MRKNIRLKKDPWLAQLHRSFKRQSQDRAQIWLAAKLVLVTTASLGPESQMIPTLLELHSMYTEEAQASISFHLKRLIDSTFRQFYRIVPNDLLKF